MSNIAQEIMAAAAAGEKIGASACLAGVPCRYDGCSKGHPLVMEWAKEDRVVLVCPEQLGGLPTPRVPSGLASGTGQQVWQGLAKVINREGCDVTSQYCLGAQRSLEILQAQGIKRAVLKQHSPSCGLGSTGSAQGGRIAGHGVFAALAINNGLEVCSDEDL